MATHRFLLSAGTYRQVNELFSLEPWVAVAAAEQVSSSGGAGASARIVGDARLLAMADVKQQWQQPHGPLPR